MRILHRFVKQKGRIVCTNTGEKFSHCVDNWVNVGDIARRRLANWWRPECRNNKLIFPSSFFLLCTYLHFRRVGSTAYILSQCIADDLEFYRHKGSMELCPEIKRTDRIDVQKRWLIIASIDKIDLILQENNPWDDLYIWIFYVTKLCRHNYLELFFG